MKRALAVILLLVLLLTGCDGSDPGMDRAMAMRQKLQQAGGCSFTVEITADYGDTLHTFGMECTGNEQGDLSFTVSKPETIQGITGTISDAGGNLTFDGEVLAFPMLADGQITPVSAPWLLLRTLRGGYMRACTQTDTGLKLIIDDSYQEDSLQLDIWLDENDLPAEAEILWQGRRVVSLKVNNFLYE